LAYSAGVSDERPRKAGIGRGLWTALKRMNNSVTFSGEIALHSSPARRSKPPAWQRKQELPVMSVKFCKKCYGSAGLVRSPLSSRRSRPSPNPSLAITARRTQGRAWFLGAAKRTLATEHRYGIHLHSTGGPAG
jgi:hypothetical protein